MKIIECPRDAMQGLKGFIPTSTKVAYLNQLFKVGFHTIDFGSFVSPTVIPQMKDTAQVLEGLDLTTTSSKLLAIVANQKGAKLASVHPEINFLGYPLSISETFQLRNTRKNIVQSFEVVEDIQEICQKKSKKLIIYLSMAFGNPYNDPYHPEILEEFSERLTQMDIQIIQISDTIGTSTPESIQLIFSNLLKKFPKTEFGSHFHSGYDTANEKIFAAYQAGCSRFDGAIGGYGGCPMAKNELTGNITTEQMIQLFLSEKIDLDINFEAFSEAIRMSQEIFP